MLQVNLSQLSPSARMNFSIRNTALATTTGVQRLRRVPGRSTISESSLMLSPDIADDVGEHKHRSPPPTLHSPQTFASAAHSRCPPQDPLRPAGRQARSAGGGRCSSGGPRAGAEALGTAGSFPVPADGPPPLPARRGEGTLTSPGLPDLGAQHAPAWARRCRSISARPRPPPRASPRPPLSASSSGSGATLRMGLNKP